MTGAFRRGLYADLESRMKGLVGSVEGSFPPDQIAQLLELAEHNEPAVAVLSVHGGEYDPIESSEHAFERAAALLEWALLANNAGGPSAADLATYLARWDSS